MSVVPVRRKYVSQQVAAHYAGVHPKTVRRWIEKGLIQGFKLPGSRAIRVDLNEVEEALRTMPATVMRAGTSNYGPAARIVTVRDEPRKGWAEPVIENVTGAK